MGHGNLKSHRKNIFVVSYAKKNRLRCCDSKHIVFHRSWRSIVPQLIFAAVVSIIIFYLTSEYEINGLSFQIYYHNRTLHIYLPVFLIFTLILIARPLMLLKDCKHEVGCHHLKSVSGRMSLKRTKAEVSYEDLHGVKVIQSPFERMLNVGTIIAWTALADNPDIIMKGLYNPEEKASIITKKLDEIHSKNLN